MSCKSHFAAAQFPGFLNLLTGHQRSNGLWIYSTPLTLGGLQSSELYLFINRPLFPAPCASLVVSCLFSAFFLGLRGFPYLLAAPTYVHRRPRFASAPCSRFSRTGFRFEIQFNLGALLLMNRALLVARFHPCPASASLLTFCLPLRSLASSAPLEFLELCLSHLEVLTPSWFLCAFEVGIAQLPE